MKKAITINMIAACGMNCALCLGFLRDKDRCPGCRSISPQTVKYCRKCILRNCQHLKKHGWKYCSPKCQYYPCRRLKNLDKRYRTKYGMSMLDNLEHIDKEGITKFLAAERKRWVRGDKIFCVHRKKYFPIKPN